MPRLAGIIIGRARFTVSRPRCVTGTTRVTIGVIAGNRRSGSGCVIFPPQFTTRYSSVTKSPGRFSCRAILFFYFVL
jgi:hypothetical protein